MAMKLVTMATETVLEEYEDSSDDFDELALLMEESKNLESQLKIFKSSANEISNLVNQSHFANNIDKHNENTPTPGGTPTLPQMKLYSHQLKGEIKLLMVEI